MVRFRIIAFEGPIGAGKSTLLHKLGSLPNVVIVPEPLHLWRNLAGKHNLLEEYYANPSQHAACFQLWAAHTRMQAVQDVLVEMKERAHDHDDVYVCVERMGCGVRSFTRFLHAQKHISDGWYAAVDHVLKDWEQKLKVDLIVHVNVSLEEAQKRIAERGRSEEGGVSLEMQRQIETYLNDDMTSAGVRQLSLSADKPWGDPTDLLHQIAAAL